MAWAPRFGWRFTVWVGVVIGLVFAALVSSWFGIEAERRGKEAVSAASLLARVVFDVSVHAYELEILQDRLVAESLRSRTSPATAAVRETYVAAISTLRGELGRITQMPLEAKERAVLEAGLRTLDGYEQFAAELADPKRSTVAGRRATREAALKDAVPTATRAAELLRQLAREVGGRAGRYAEEASEAGDRARTLLIIFGSVSLLLALYLANGLGIAMTKAGELMDRLAELARIDGLTGLPNRRVWDDELGKGLDRARRTGQPCTVGLIDLDNFKRYNDIHGHQAGDALLRDAARALARRMRGGDLIARYGGEEFAVLLHGCDARSALKLFERLHGAMPDGQTFSAGVSQTSGREPDSDVLKRADEALYRAKSEGRDRTVAHESGTVPA